jgi:hypothetical protein
MLNVRFHPEFSYTFDMKIKTLPSQLFPSSLPWLLPILLVLLFVAVLIWLPWQAQRMEANERQEQLIADTLWVEQALQFQLTRHQESLANIAEDFASGNVSNEILSARLRLYATIWWQAILKFIPTHHPTISKMP